MLSNANLPNGFWAEAVATIVHLINRSPKKAIDEKVPELMWSRKQPSYKHLRVFGCEAYCHIPKEFRDKLAPKSKKCIFLGYGDSGEMGYRLWEPEGRQIMRSNDVYFNEEKLHKNPMPVTEIRRVVFEEDANVRNAGGAQNGQQAPLEPGQNQAIVDGNRVKQQAVVAQPVLRRSARIPRAPDRFVPSMDYVMLMDCGEPSCYKEAMLSDDKLKWEKAMQSEMDSLHKNQMWTLVTFPKGKHELPCKWVYKMKITLGDEKPKSKVRLVAKGFKQQQGIDCKEIFSPIVKMTSLRCVLVLAAKEDMDLVQMDV